MYCSICKYDKAAEMVEEWAIGQSLRKVAAKHNLGYRSLQRHLDLCLAAILAEYEENVFREALRVSVTYVRYSIAAARRPKRRKSIIKKPVQFTWSRRAWKKN
jgi:hypothetical protein